MAESSLAQRVSARLKICLVVSVAASTLNCGQNSELEGQWQCGGLPVSIYDDGVASLYGEGASWTVIGNDAIRLEYQEKNQAKITELRITGKTDSGQRAAVLGLSERGVNCADLSPDQK